MEQLKYSKSIPGPDSYSIPSSLEKRGSSLKPRLADMSLNHLKDVAIKANIVARPRSLFRTLFYQQRQQRCF